jgi:hypothetical protein
MFRAGFLADMRSGRRIYSSGSAQALELLFLGWTVGTSGTRARPVLKTPGDVVDGAPTVWCQLLDGVAVGGNCLLDEEEQGLSSG